MSILANRITSRLLVGKKYMGIGPSAHGYNGISRSWNEQHHLFEHSEKLPNEIEVLVTDRYNEYVMTGLRTIWGVSLDRIEAEFGPTYSDYSINKLKIHR
jgi:oxygen-independent coproporphyrinogen-3 oxidase